MHPASIILIALTAIVDCAPRAHVGDINPREASPDSLYGDVVNSDVTTVPGPFSGPGPGPGPSYAYSGPNATVSVPTSTSVGGNNGFITGTNAASQDELY